MRRLEPVSTLLADLLGGVLAGVRRDVPGSIGTAVSAAHPAQERGAGQLQVLAASGVGHVLPPITTGHLWGPSLLAAAGEEPIVTADLWHDPRWPHLTLDAVRTQVPEQQVAVVSQVRGVAAVPGMWDDEGVVTLSVYLDRPADHGTLAVLSRHERLVTSAITIADIATRSAEDSDHVLDMLASRAAIEQAKGSIMALRRCDADEAWAVLRQASQQFNVKLRELAVAIVEHVGQAPAQQPDDTARQILPGSAARRAAETILQALAQPSAAEPRQLVGTHLSTDSAPRPVS
jgi:hypothetical protein